MLTEVVTTAALWAAITAAIAAMMAFWLRLPIWPAALFTFISVLVLVCTFGRMP